MARHCRIAIAVCAAAFSILAGASNGHAVAGKDESRLPGGERLAQQPPLAEPLELPGTDATTPAEEPAVPETGEPPETTDGDTLPDDMSLGEIPEITTVELTADMARRAIDSYLLIQTKYADTDLESAENLQDFVDQHPQGKAFEADIKAAGFATAEEWNLAIITVGLAYATALDDQSADLLEQIAEIEADTNLAQDMKDRIITSLKAMIPSENNRKVIAELMADPVYAEKLKQLEFEEE